MGKHASDDDKIAILPSRSKGRVAQVEIEHAEQGLPLPAFT